MDSFREFEIGDYQAIKVTMNRYLPKWKWDRFEDYQNDYRWSRSSPPVEIKGFRRYYNTTSDNLSKIDTDWIDIGKFKLDDSASRLMMPSLLTVCGLSFSFT